MQRSQRAKKLRGPELRASFQSRALVASHLANLRGRRVSSLCRSEAQRFLPKQAQKRRASSHPLKARDSSYHVISSSQSQRFLPSASSNSGSCELVEAHNQLIYAKIHPLSSLASGRSRIHCPLPPRQSPLCVRQPLVSPPLVQVGIVESFQPSARYSFFGLHYRRLPN
ncbi:hypothetical protein QN277_010356 [Acacia crassicarpa]|uniref:Uncharacterized protein n=1 Tax=Acacia crassicarpa TaxID=499986 RepID=A0AAE1IMQ1_9FABA|nr:hypothetical protein QN277_010356 [Acacia crassicarpa]